MNVLLLSLVLASAPAGSAASQGEATQVTDEDATRRYQKIEALVRAKRWEQATQALATAELPLGPTLRLRGQIFAGQGDHKAAAEAFAGALELSPQDAPLRLHLARSLLADGRPAEAERALVGSEELAESVPAQPLLVARVDVALGRIDRAYTTLVRAVSDFPHEAGPRLELVGLCVRHQARKAAREWAEGFVVAQGRRALTPAVAIALVELLYADARALPLLERVAGLFPDEVKLQVGLAYAYAHAEHWYTAARLFERTGRGYYFEAADQYRMSGFYRRALKANLKVADEAQRVSQRLSILFSAQEMTRVVALAPTLVRLGLYSPANRYRLAYAHYQLGEHLAATRLARGLLESSQAQSARALLRAMGRETSPAAQSDPDGG